MMDRKIIHGRVARTQLIEGAEKLHDAVASTLGPRGRNVVIEQLKGLPHVTKDGVTVAKTIFLFDEFENMGAQLLKQASIKTGEKAGDGTTTSTVLAMAFLKEGMKELKKGMSPVEIARRWAWELRIMLRDIQNILPHESCVGERITSICTVAANGNEEIGKLLGHVLEDVGPEGVVDIAIATDGKTSVEEVRGAQLEAGYVSPYFSTDTEKLNVEFRKPYIIVTDEHLWHSSSMIPLLELLAGEKKPFVIIAPKIEKEALGMLVVNTVRGAIQAVAIEAPGIGEAQVEFLRDVALLSGATFITKEYGLSMSKPSLDMFGMCEKIKVNDSDTVMMEGYGKAQDVEIRIKSIQERILDAPKGVYVPYMEARINRLKGLVTNISIGAHTEVEGKEKLDIYDDALCAGKAALREGIVPGGGGAYYLLSEHGKMKALLNPRTLKALKAPMEQIMKNEDLSRKGKRISREALLSGVKIYDPNENEYVPWQIVPDPLTVVKSALGNAISVASTLIMTDCAIGFEAPSETSKHRLEELGD